MDEQRIPFFDVMGWNPSTVDFDIWLGTANAETIAKLGSNAKAGPLVGYEPAEKHPTGWGYRAPGHHHAA
jgi:hypothetical protein